MIEPVPDLPKLIRLLSLPQYYPSSLHIRNLLLAPLIEQGITVPDKHRCWAAWVAEHGDKLVFEVLGNVSGEEKDEVYPNQLWGIVILSNGKRCIPGRPMVDLWISHEPLVRSNTLTGSVAPPSSESRDMFEQAYFDIIQPTMRKWNVDKSLMFGIHRCWADLVRSHNKEDTFAVDCTKMIKRLEKGKHGEPPQMPDGYRIRQVGLEDCLTIRDSSGHPRPLDYYQSRIQLSSTVEKVESGELAAWALSHNNLSIASLHTAESHRRSGFGKAIVADLNRQLYDCLANHPLHQGPIYAHADCEAWNVSTVNWFTKLGFEPSLYCTWMGIEA